MTAIRKVSAITALAIFVQILLGALTRLTDSGLSCPDWPLCYGLWFPSAAELVALEADYTFWQVMSEWTHRFNAAVLVGPLTLVLLVLAWRKRQEAPAIFKLMVAAAVLLLIQAGLGGFTVLDRNSPWSVAVHLGVALVLLAQVLLVYLRARNPSKPERGAAHALVWPAAALALVTVASGAMVAQSRLFQLAPLRWRRNPRSQRSRYRPQFRPSRARAGDRRYHWPALGRLPSRRSHAVPPRRQYGVLGARSAGGLGRWGDSRLLRRQPFRASSCRCHPPGYRRRAVRQSCRDGAP